MKLIIGFGNPGTEYNFTRHNFGFLVLDFYAKVKQYSWQGTKFNAEYFRDQQGNFFIKPQTYYNESGQAVKSFMQYYKINLSDLLVICDDFDLEFGTVRYRAKGSNGGNNGLKSIEQYLKTSDFARIRLGTNNTTLRKQMGDVNFVLGHFTPEEKTVLPEILQQTTQKINQIINS